ncbi:MAG: GntR family transcriptional regulator [Lachnospiraceae bacterium]|nr:GntR family transcriptional regulator [Lachnospiraceae bacterium]
MVIILNDDSDVPVYLQIRNQIIIGISDGRLAPGEKLPTVRALAEEIGINSMTVNKAYQLLKQEGYILTDKRNGARVRESFEKRGSLSPETGAQLQRIISEAKISGMTKEAFFKECSRYFGEEE